MNTQELLWKYAEGNCNPEERAAIEKQLAGNPALQWDLDSILEVQSVLTGMEADAPSLRFTKNVMDALPDIYPGEITEPLVKPVWKNIFWLAMVALATWLLFLLRSESPGSVVPPYVGRAMAGINQVAGQVPDLVLQYLVLTLLSVGLLVFLDKMFLKKINRLLLL